ncbi:MAG: esterase-like activity of phytase family protein [Hydrogenophaga sp.]|jgi:hypothetical protein|nr:esterase-like activity of phytase family protein [Hydrogenophaga sp.]
MTLLRQTCTALLGLAGLMMLANAPAAQPSQVRGVVQLTGSTVDGLRVAELSGLAWDARSQVLHGLSDRGHLIRFRLEMTADGHLRSVVPTSASMLQDTRPGAGTKHTVDAEGLSLWQPPGQEGGVPQLLVSTEGLPQVLQVDLEGRVQGTMPLPAALGDARRYRARNRMLEAVTQSPHHGLLVAAEAALRDHDPALHTVHGRSRSWSFAAHDPGQSRLKAMDVIDGERLVVLERSRVGKGKARELVNVLRLIDLDRCAPQQVCEAQDLLVLEPTGGSENFEGMTWLGGQQFLLVSDSHGSLKAPTVFMLIDLSAPGRE